MKHCHHSLHKLCIFAAAAYENLPKIDGYYVEAIKRGQTDIFLFYNDAELVVAIRGTENAAEWRNDFRFLKRAVPKLHGKYHRGFVRAANAAYISLASRLAFLSDGRHVTFVGHSLGGALAQLMAVMLEKEDPAFAPDCVVTFGSPRFASVVAAYYINRTWHDKITRVEMFGDGVCHTPMAIVGYRHVGKSVPIGHSFAPKASIVGRFIQKALRTNAAHKVDGYLTVLRGRGTD